MHIKPIVAAYALFETQFQGSDAALDFIYESTSHDFLGYLPNIEEFNSVPVNKRTGDKNGQPLNSR